jgi:hypothetical protein
VVPMSQRISRDEKFYYLNLEGRITGPFSFERIRRGIANRTIEAAWIAQRVGSSDWSPIINLCEFRDLWDQFPELRSQTSRETPRSKRGSSRSGPTVVKAVPTQSCPQPSASARQKE